MLLSMGIFDGIRAERLIRQAMAAGDVESPAVEKIIKKLKSLAKAAIPKIFSRLSGAQREQFELIVKLLTKLANAKTLDLYFKGFADADSRVIAGAAKALKDAENIDASRFLSLFDNAYVSKPAVLEVLYAHRKGLNAEQLLRYAYKLQQNDLTMLFRIIDGIVDESLVPELINRTDAKDPIMRAEIIKVLSRFKSEQVHETLERLLDDGNKTVRLAALEGLSNMGSGMDVGALCKLIRDPDIKIQSKAIEALIKLDHPHTVQYLLDPLQDESEYARRGAVEVLNALGNPNAIKDLLQAIKDRDWWVRSRAADALGRIGGRKVAESVIELIKDDDEFIRRSAIEIINATEDPDTYDVLVKAVGDTDWWVRERAIDGLAALGNTKAIPVLISLLNKEQTDSDMEVIIIKALAKLNAKSAIKPIISQLKDGSETVKKEALHALGRLTDEPNAVLVKSVINKVAQTTEGEVREAALDALSKISTQYPTKSDRPPDRSKADESSRSKSHSTISKAPSPISDNDSMGAIVLPDTVTRSVGDAVAESADPAQLQPNDVLANRYRFIRQVGKGAFGTVVLVEDLMINEQIILKFLNSHVASDESMIKRFVYELRFARKITHQNVIRIYDMLTFGKSSAISMEYFPSHTLGAELAGGKPLEMYRAVKLIREICSGMASAHKANVVHRDLKPGNVLINQDDLVKIVDFGVAAATRQTETRLTKTGLLIGTPVYMSPEQVLGRKVDARTDIYCLGVIMYEMFTGKAPYSGGDSMSIMYRHVQGQADAPRNLNPEIPHTLNAVIMKTMAAEPDKRFQTMEELRDRLTSFAN